MDKHEQRRRIERLREIANTEHPHMPVWQGVEAYDLLIEELQDMLSEADKHKHFEAGRAEGARDSATRWLAIAGMVIASLTFIYGVIDKLVP